MMNRNFYFSESFLFVFFAKKCQTFAGSSFFNVRICCFSSSFMTANEQSLGFGLLTSGQCGAAVLQRKMDKFNVLGSILKRVIISYRSNEP